jgi:glyoxylase-like metal-dependent hydrolase (beta-lactamase superfamily II)
VSDLAVVGIPNGTFDQNCWLLADAATREAVIVDPGEEADRFLAELRDRGWTLTAIWLTHAHIDHILGVGAVHAGTGAAIHLPAGDRALYENLPQQAQWFGMHAVAPPPVTHWLTTGQVLPVGAHCFEVRHVPGHSPGHVAFVAPGVIVGGDVLFAGSIGRTDLPGGSLPELEDSIRREFYTLPDMTRVLTGHGPETTIGEERRANPFVRG